MLLIVWSPLATRCAGCRCVQVLKRALVAIHTSTVVPERELSERASLIHERVFEWCIGVACGVPSAVGAAGSASKVWPWE